MKVTIENYPIPAAHLGPENPLPMFRENMGTKQVRHDGSFRLMDEFLFGSGIDFKVLPHSMQDGYGRKRELTEIKTIVLENDVLKARFLPDFGGRLISLEEKESKRELLYRNPVLQPANLAIRNAWFSGGIEWNIGIPGHSAHTCSPVFFASMTDGDAGNFLRLWEYERIRRVFWQIDFHLPRGARELRAHVRIVNDDPGVVPMYWWTNIAVPEAEGTRVFSGTDEVIYIRPASPGEPKAPREFGKDRLPHLPSLPGRDASYPLSFNYSSEYFFQTPESTAHPWEAVSQSDGSLFYERSTARLRYRKMFCWGNLPGGRRWCDFLAEKGRGAYIEVQAGLAPTQVHGLLMPARSQWDFTQFFGITDIPPDEARGEWGEARDRIFARVDERLPGDEIDDLHRKYTALERLDPEEIIHYGTGWGALERRRRERSDEDRPIYRGMVFPDGALGGLQKPWIQLLEEGKTDGPDSMDEISWITDRSWIPYLEEAAREDEGNPWPRLYLGTLLMEGGKFGEALECWRQSAARKPLALTWRNIARALIAMEQDMEESDEAVEAMRRAVDLEGGNPSRCIAEELMNLLLSRGRYQEAWDYYTTLPEPVRNHEGPVSAAAAAALELKKYDFIEHALSREFAMIREGDRRLVDLWFAYQKQKNANAGAAASPPADPPKSIDFRMVSGE